MGRTYAQIRQVIEDQKNATPELAAIDSTSNTAFYKLIADIVAFVQWVQESFWDLFKNEVKTIADESEAGVALWYKEMVQEFQYGDELIWDPIKRKYYYEIIDESKKIITHCAVTDVVNSVSGQLRIKVKAGDQENRRVLTQDELSALLSYIKKRKFAGTNTSTTSYIADKLLCNLTVFYDPIIPLQTVMVNVQAAVENYVKNLPFDGIFSINTLEDKVQAVTGVKYIVIDSLQSKVGAGLYEVISVKYNPEAGDMDVDSASTIYNPINYIADV